MTLTKPNLSIQDQKRFWSKVDIDIADKCWPWAGSKNKWGHGYFHEYHGASSRLPSDPGNTTTHKAHRIALYIATGQWPGEELVIHRCGNPSCCNPNHLFIGTAKELGEINRTLKKMPRQDGHHNRNSKLSESQVEEIRQRIKSGEGNTSIAADYPVSHSMISKIRQGNSW